jgi:hypothetical protein
MAHEVSVTFPMQTKSGSQVWVNAASVNPKKPKGARFSEDEVRRRLLAGTQKAHSVSATHKGAIVKAKARSKKGPNASPASILIGDIMNE